MTNNDSHMIQASSLEDPNLDLFNEQPILAPQRIVVIPHSLAHRFTLNPLVALEGHGMPECDL